MEARDAWLVSALSLSPSDRRTRRARRAAGKDDQRCLTAVCSLFTGLLSPTNAGLETPSRCMISTSLFLLRKLQPPFALGLPAAVQIVPHGLPTSSVPGVIAHSLIIRGPWLVSPKMSVMQ